MEDLLRERIDELLCALRLSQGEFASRIGVSANAITNWKARGIKGSSYEKISTAFPNVNMAWLKSGEGDMFLRDAPTPSGVPYYDVDFIGGFDLVGNDQTVNPDGFVNISKFNKATCLCNITGHSMEPEISHGDIIALRRIEDWSFLLYGEIYAIVTKNNLRTVKRLGPDTVDGSYTLIPSNKSPDYAPQEIKKSDLLAVFEVLGCMKRF